MTQLSFHSPVGALTVTEENGAIVSLDWGWAMETGSTPLLEQAKARLLAYFAGERTPFDLPLDAWGTSFQKRVWAEMRAIPHGQTRTYGAVAERLGSGPRAVGTACGANPIPILIPCHRIVGANGGLGGYSGADGTTTKRWLLDLEAR